MAAGTARSWNFSKYFGLFSKGKNNFLPKCLFLDHVICIFFSILSEWGWWVLKSTENSILFIFFIFEGFPYTETVTSLSMSLKILNFKFSTFPFSNLIYPGNLKSKFIFHLKVLKGNFLNSFAKRPLFQWHKNPSLFNVGRVKNTFIKKHLKLIWAK